ncbi:SGNH/GDSL hydrolase family protein [Sphingomonas sp. BIUV-7]|uniref:SGNH/GDSL hydrolase family protein n=1 Tax=Sphingomonas natans TaxID=3063330 RepID=A0ABT8YCM8_9SPHN|nr:SGNH/GDSL hydrolase family protein [Sphingomonas sp. BIUV-7]MDO6416106.1 SGNH/GDSL hydrolase family protein [Sphingomonas sp. BIUV-7]
MVALLRNIACFVLLAAGSVSPASAASYPGLYVFGDSLVDVGNAFYGSNGTQANPVNGYSDLRFTNGLNFADYLAQAVGAPALQPAFLGGTGVAVGGSTAQFSDPLDQNISFLEQIAYLTNFVAPSISNDALVLVTFGGNDVRNTIGTAGPVDFKMSGDDFATGLAALYGLGARNFVITGSPDIGLLPISIATAGAIPDRLAELTARSEDISALFEAKSGGLAVLPGANVTFFDLFAYEHALLADPTVFGLPSTLDSTAPCQIVGGGSPQTANCTNSLYFDPVHPTTQVHQAIANAIIAELGAVPEPATWMTMILGFGVVGFVLRQRGSVIALG